MNERNDLVQSDNNETPSTPLQPMSFVDILDGMFVLYRNHFLLFLGIVAVYIVIGFGLDLISVSVLTGVEPSTSIVIAVFTAIGSFIVSFLVVAGLAYASALVYLDRDITAQDALQQAWRRFFSLLGSAVLWGLVVVGLFVTIIGIPFSIYFSVRWGLYTLPVLFEATTARNALRRSTELVRGTWWRVFGIMLAVSVIAFMISFILEVSSGFILTLIGVAEIEAATPWDMIRRLFMPMPNEVGWFAYAIRRFVSVMIAGLAMPIGVIGSALLYFDLRIRKEAFDIEMQVTD
ncbi:MAG: hypothetical protein OXL96_28290 [Candidatus Poribacteria bacterium]|nr:hypothetical protein [Candidatus Poribacteria bacterium]